MSNFEIKIFSGIKDNRGSLLSLEALKNVPFEIRRVYFLYDLDSNFARGFHAHKKLEQLIFCISGSCNLILNDGVTEKVINLNSPEMGVLIRGTVWREMNSFSTGAVLLVLASEYYDESDYIRDYDEFLKYISILKRL